MMYITVTELFLFASLIVSIISLIVSLYNSKLLKKKQPPILHLGWLFSTIIRANRLSVAPLYYHYTLIIFICQY